VARRRCRVHRTAAAIRRGIVEIGQDSAAPDFGRPEARLGKKTD
jgi:hypothetical protein